MLSEKARCDLADEVNSAILGKSFLCSSDGD